MSDRPVLPGGLGRFPQPGDRYSPDRGEHHGHVLEVLSLDGVRFNILGEPLRSVLVRCHTCLLSWTFPGPEQDI